MISFFDTIEEFEAWVREMDSAIERFRHTLPADVNAKLDFSVESLNAMEAWLLQTYAHYRELTDPSERATWDAVGRYIGETFRRDMGGRWNAQLDGSNSSSYRIPELTGFSAKPTPLTPHTLATAAVQRRTTDYLVTVLRNAKIQEEKWKSRAEV